MSRNPALVLAALLAGCTSWHTSTLPPAETVRAKPGQSIEVVTAAGTREVRSPRVVNDSLFGLVLAPNGIGDAPYATALADVLQVRVKRADKTRTVLAVVAVAGAVTAVLAAAGSGGSSGSSGGGSGSSGGGSPSFCNDPSSCFSCPLVYSWDGHHWRLDSGTFGGAIARGLTRTDLDNLEFVVPDGGRIHLRVADEQQETDHLDAIHVLALDHVPGVGVAPDPTGRFHAFTTPTIPFRAVDDRGRDVLGRIVALDDRSWISDPTGRDSARAADLRSGIEVAFARPAGETRAHLVVDANNTEWATMLLQQWVAAHGTGTQAWYDTLNADPRRALADFAPLIREGFLSVQLFTRRGWERVGQYWEAGPEVLKRQVLELDLRDVPGDTVRVRLESAPSFWRIDRVAMAFGPEQPATVHELRLVSARTRAGRDIRSTLDSVDGRELVMERGQGADLVFGVPDLPAGLRRTFLLRSTGWYRIESDTTQPPNLALLRRLATEPLALSRMAVGRLNDALATLTREAAQ